MDQSPFDASYGTAAGDGDDLVVLGQCLAPASEDCGSGWDRTEAALRRDDGTWWTLPAFPFDGYFQLATAGARAILGGIACVDGACEDFDGEVAFAMLTEDRSEWIRLDAPDVELPVVDTELTTGPGPAALASFSIGSEQYWGDEEGQVVDWEPRPAPDPAGPHENGCVLGDTFVSYHWWDVASGDAAPSAEPEYVGEVYLQPLGGSEEPISAGMVPEGVTGTVLCAGDHFTISDQIRQAALDIETEEWTVGPTNLAEVTGGFVSPISGRLARSPHGSTIFIQGAARTIFRRDGAGLWESTGLSGHVFSTASAVLVIGGDRTVTQVWPD